MLGFSGLDICAFRVVRGCVRVDSLAVLRGGSQMARTRLRCCSAWWSEGPGARVRRRCFLDAATLSVWLTWTASRLAAGVKAVTYMEGEAVWEAGRAGRYSMELVRRAAETLETKAEGNPHECSWMFLRIWAVLLR